MIRGLRIENFRGVASGGLDGFTPLTILVGPNGSGKSTVLDALQIGASRWPALGLFEVFERRMGRRIGGRWLVKNGDIDKVLTIGVEYADPEATTSVRVNVTSLISPNKHEQIRLDQSVIRGGSTTRKGSSLVLDSASIESARQSLMGQAGNSPLGQFPFPNIAFVAHFNPSHADAMADVFSDTVRAGRDDELNAMLELVIPDFDHLLVLTEDNKPILCIKYKDRTAPVIVAGDGILRLVHLMLDLSSAPGGLALLEEPEVHQHPASLSITAKAIWAAVDRGIQVVIATHSQDLIDALLAQASETQIDKLSVQRMWLRGGALSGIGTTGKDAEFSRAEVMSDLR